MVGASPRLSLKNAFPCPRCRSINTKIPDSWIFEQGYVMRRRRCADCHTVFGTTEYVIDPVHDQPRLADINAQPYSKPFGLEVQGIRKQNDGPPAYCDDDDNIEEE